MLSYVYKCVVTPKGERERSRRLHQLEGQGKYLVLEYNKKFYLDAWLISRENLKNRSFRDCDDSFLP